MIGGVWDGAVSTPNRMRRERTVYSGGPGTFVRGGQIEHGSFLFQGRQWGWDVRPDVTVMTANQRQVCERGRKEIGYSQTKKADSEESALVTVYPV